MATPTFSEQDAQDLIAHAQAAPLANLKHASYISDLLRRFAAWHEHVTKPAAKPARQGRQGSPARQPEDPAS